MMAEITDGNSREQILEVLGVEDIETLRMKASALWNANYCDDGAVTSILASSLWLNQDVDFRQETLQRLAETYYASSFAGEMGSKKYTQALQEWVNVQTGELLKDAAFDTQMDSETVMKLIATIYYRAKWSDEFSKGNTENGTFYAADGTETCSFMHQTMDQTYYWGEKFSAVNKSLRESGRMWFLLPDEGVSVDELIQDEETMNFLFSMDNWENSKYLEVRLQVPKFDISSQFDLTGDLQRMGITEVFDSAVADYSPLTTDVEEIALSSATHTARVIIDEEGCIAAAYTQMQYSGSAAPPDETVDFILDRPFLFMITGSDGTPLFIGVVNHP